MYEIYLPKTNNNNNTQSKQKHIAQTYDLLVPFSYRFECQKLFLVGDPKVSAFFKGYPSDWPSLFIEFQF